MNLSDHHATLSRTYMAPWNTFKVKRVQKVVLAAILACMYLINDHAPDQGMLQHNQVAFAKCVP